MMRVSDSKYGCAALALVACVAVQVTVASQANADCQERLANVDASLAEADIDPQMRTVLKTMRDQAAQKCAAGSEAGAVAGLQSVEMMLSTMAQASSQKAAQEAEKVASRAQLTPEYLKGKWCTNQDGDGEMALWVFSGDGTFQSGPAAYNYAPVSQGDMKDFWQSFDAVISKEPDRFVVGRYKPGTTFDRGQGSCQPTGYRP
jgi:hypothetical protein